MADPIRWGILGLGKIAHTFAADLALVPDARLQAVASRDPSKAKAFAEEHGAVAGYGSYSELLADPEVDVIYIATPHTHHLPHSIAAMEAGKHVLCEKPMGITLAEVQQQLDVARKKGVFFMEALWSRFNPALLDAVGRVHSGELGEVGYLKADFAFPALDRDPSGRLLNPALAGGSLLDIGIYPVFLAYWVLGLPDTIQVSVKFHDTGVEKQIAILMEYPGAMALLYSGLTSHSEMRAEISCSKGTLTIDPRWHETSGYTELGEPPIHKPFPKRGKGYTYEVEEVHRCLRSGLKESPSWSHADSLALHGLLQQIRELAGIEFPSEG